MEQRIYPTTTFIVRCPMAGCRYTCNHDKLTDATACQTQHTGTHHPGGTP